MRELHLCTSAPEGTRAVAAAVARALRPGDVVALTGELGAGKTCFVQGAAAALGVAGRVTSPSFVLRRDYDGRVPVAHLDVYRLDTLAEVADLGLGEPADRAAVTFVEWGDAVSPLLPPDRLEVELTLDDPGDPGDRGDGEAQRRRIALRPWGGDWSRRLATLAADLDPWSAPRAADGDSETDGDAPPC